MQAADGVPIESRDRRWPLTRRIAAFIGKLMRLVVSLQVLREVRRWWNEYSLACFCRTFGFDHHALRISHDYRLFAASLFRPGHVEVLRIYELGQFGNFVLQILNAALLARRIGARTIQVTPFNGGPKEGSYLLGGLTIEVSRHPRTTRPTLQGVFWSSDPFAGSPAVDLDGVEDLIETVLKPLFADALGHVPPGPSDQIVMHLRGGDVFSGPILFPWYVQPPAQFYVLAALQAREAFGVTRAVLVSSDRLNPTIDVVLRELETEGFAVSFQSESFLADVRLIAGARHLAVAYGTFCEAITLLAPNVQSYAAFRLVESQRHQHLHRESLQMRVLRGRGVQIVRVADAAHDYIQPLTWDRSSAQLALMCDFPRARLSIDTPDDNTDNVSISALPTPIPPSYRPLPLSDTSPPPTLV